MQDQMYEGKAKILYKTEDKEVFLMHFKDDITAGDGEKKDTMKNKGSLNYLSYTHLTLPTILIV